MAMKIQIDDKSKEAMRKIIEKNNETREKKKKDRSDARKEMYKQRLIDVASELKTYDLIDFIRQNGGYSEPERKFSNGDISITSDKGLVTWKLDNIPVYGNVFIFQGDDGAFRGQQRGHRLGPNAGTKAGENTNPYFTIIDLYREMNFSHLDQREGWNKSVKELAIKLIDPNMFKTRELTPAQKDNELEVARSQIPAQIQRMSEQWNQMAPLGQGGIEFLEAGGLNQDTINQFKDYMKEWVGTSERVNKETGEITSTAEIGIAFRHSAGGQTSSYSVVKNNFVQQGDVSNVHTLCKLGPDNARVKIFADKPLNALSAYQSFKERGLIKKPSDVQLISTPSGINQVIEKQIEDLSKNKSPHSVFVVAKNDELLKPIISENSETKEKIISCRDTASDVWKSKLTNIFERNIIPKEECRIIDAPNHTTWFEALKSEPVITDADKIFSLLKNDRSKHFNMMVNIAKDKVGAEVIECRNKNGGVLSDEDNKRLLKAFDEALHSADDIKQKVSALAQKKTEERFNKFTILPNDDPYLTGRGIAPETIAQFNTRGDIRKDGTNKKIDGQWLPVNPDGFTVAHRSLDDKIVGYEKKGPKREPEGRSYSIFSSDSEKNVTMLSNANGGIHDVAYIGESAVDVLSAWQCDGSPQNALLMSSYGQLADDVLQDVAIRMKQNPGCELRICFDKDSAGLSFTERAKAIMASDAPETSCVHHLPPDGKDWNDSLMASEHAYKQDEQKENEEQSHRMR